MIQYEDTDIIQADLAQRRSFAATPKLEAGPSGQGESHELEQPSVVPSAIEVEYWQEDDGTWAALSPLLGVSALADTQAELFGATVEAIDEFWEILNQRYASLSDDLRKLLAVRYQNLLFRQRG
jgi:predicted RNase H-like HicB family nuclease